MEDDESLVAWESGRAGFGINETENLCQVMGTGNDFFPNPYFLMPITPNSLALS
jgi:hypothetical protein